jgi:hypothetical protein
MANLPKEVASSVEVRWAWVVVLVITPIATVMFEHESFNYALGSTIGGIVFGFLLSPIIWLVSKPFVKFTWCWYHWFNSAAFTGLVLKIGYWVIVPIVKSMVGDS